MERDADIINRFSSPRAGSGSWAEPEIVDAWRDGRVTDVPPRTIEYAPSVRCNMGDANGGCTECPYWPVRREAGCPESVAIGEFAKPDDRTVASLDAAKLVFERAKEAGVEGALFTGVGEPTICPDLVDMLAYSAGLGLCNGLYTNLIQLGAVAHLAERILDPASNLVFVRGSINFCMPETARNFARATEAHIDALYRGFRALCIARSDLLPRYLSLGRRPPSLQVSVVCDRRNVGDLPLIAGRVASIYREHSLVRDANDVFVVRPLTRHCRPKGYTAKQHDDWVIGEILREFSAVGPGASRRVLEGDGIGVRFGFGLERLDRADGDGRRAGGYEDLLCAEYAARDRCWANGLFLTVGPMGTVHLCTDRNGFGKWAVGDLREQSVFQIYHGERRRQLLDLIHGCNCGPSVCEPTCRAVRLNAIARAVRSGELTEAAIEKVRWQSAGESRLLLS